MKKTKLLLSAFLLVTFCVMSAGCFPTSKVTDQGTDKVSSQQSAQSGSTQSLETESKQEQDNKLGDYGVEIKDCRLAEDYQGKPVAIVTYGFTNYDNEDAMFMTSVTAKAYQGGIECGEAYVLDDDADYDGANQSKSIKKDATLDVQVAYELNDETTDLLIEVTEWISFNDDKITKTFKIAE